MQVARTRLRLFAALSAAIAISLAVYLISARKSPAEDHLAHTTITGYEQIHSNKNSGNHDSDSYDAYYLVDAPELVPGKISGVGLTASATVPGKFRAKNQIASGEYSDRCDFTARTVASEEAQRSLHLWGRDDAEIQKVANRTLTLIRLGVSCGEG